MFRLHIVSYLFLSILFVSVIVSCNKSDSVEVLVADFTYSIDAAKPNYVTVINTTQGDYDRISWTYNHEEITGENINQMEINLPLAGSYDVVLHVYKDGFESSVTKQISIAQDTPDEVLVADFSYSTDASKPNYVTLTNTTQGDYDRISWAYNHEEITGDNIDQIEIYLPLAGNYDVVLHVYRDDFESTITKQISIAQDAPEEPTELTLVWSDEFDGSSVNRDDWNFETGATGWGNEELQNYTDGDNVEVSNGTLKIIARKVNDDKVAGSYTSSRITSKKNFLYGRLEARAKMPVGKGVWPAFWMLGANIYTAGYPACGEIDIMEYVGFEPDFVHASVHTTASAGTNEYNKTIKLETAEEEFHIYGIVWTETSIGFYIDDPANVFYTYSPANKTDDNWPFNKNQFFILNLAIGGTWGGYEGIDNSIFPQTYEIDYVRVYQ